MDIESLSNNVDDLFSWIQTSHWILKYHLHLGTKQSLFLFLERSGYIDALESNLTCTRLIQANNRSANRGFTAAGFSNKAVGFARVNIK
ncbi:hypothetical protein D3C81_1378110 [compost metagenome]